jgi:protein-tyrosine phosphatase
VTTPTLAIVDDPRRALLLEAAHNVRDLGGYTIADGRTIAWGRLWRADGLGRLTAADLAALSPLHLATIIDLRTAAEIETAGRFPYERHPVDLVHLPVVDVTWVHEDLPSFDHHDDPEVEFLAWAYADMLADGGPRFGDALRHLARPGVLPAMFHCAAGKDRTGLLAALALAGLGVDDDVIAADYALTAVAMVRMRAFWAAQSPEAAARIEEVPSVLLAARPEAMVRTLAALRDVHGSIEAYLANVGVDAATVAALADALTD